MKKPTKAEQNLIDVMQDMCPKLKKRDCLLAIRAAERRLRQWGWLKKGARRPG